MTQITVKDLRFLLDFAKRDKHHVIIRSCIDSLSQLIENKDDDDVLDLFDRNSLVACKLWQNEDFISKAREIIEEIPTILENRLPIHKEIEKIATDAAAKGYGKYLSECTDSDWNCIEEAICRELTEQYAGKYNRNLKVQIRCICPDGSIKMLNGISDELTHRVVSISLDNILTSAAEVTHTPRNLFKFYVIKPDTDETGKETSVNYPLYHIDDITKEMLNCLSPEQQEEIYYVE